MEAPGKAAGDLPREIEPRLLQVLAGEVGWEEKEDVQVPVTREPGVPGHRPDHHPLRPPVLLDGREDPGGNNPGMVTLVFLRPDPGKYLLLPPGPDPLLPSPHAHLTSMMSS